MFYDNKALTLLNMDVVGAPYKWAQGKKVSLSKICHTYTEVMKLGTVIPCLDKSKKYMNHVTHTLISAGISIFSVEISEICYIKKNGYRLLFDT